MNTPQRYRKKPVTIEAVQWDGTVEGSTPIIDWVLAGGGTARWLDLDATAWINIDTPEGTMRAGADDYIVRGVQGEFYPVKPDIFAATYEEEEGVSATSRAADVIARCWPNGRGVRKDDSAILARALADARLLRPDLPKPDSGGEWADTRGGVGRIPAAGGHLCPCRR